IRINLGCRNIQRIQTVTDERQIIQPLDGLATPPDPLGEGGAEEVVRQGPVGRREKRESIDQRPAARNTRVTSGEREPLVELPADVPGDDDRGGPGGRPDGNAVSQPLVPYISAEDEHRTIDRDVIALIHLVDIAEVVGESVTAVGRIEVSDLGIDVEL